MHDFNQNEFFVYISYNITALHAPVARRIRRRVAEVCVARNVDRIRITEHRQHETEAPTARAHRERVQVEVIGGHWTSKTRDHQLTLDI